MRLGRAVARCCDGERVPWSGRAHRSSPASPVTAPPAVFAPLSGPGVNLGLPKLIYVVLNLVGVGVVAYKLRVMGLLPLTSADWVSLLPSRHPAEFSAGAQPMG